MDEHYSAGTRGDTPPDWLNEAVAKSAAEVERRNAIPADEAAAIAEYVDTRNAIALESTAEKRAMATPQFGPDLSEEIDTANRQAFTIVRQRVAWRTAMTAPRQTTAAPAPVATTAIRPRERRDRSGRSSQRSGDSGSDSDGSEPAPPLTVAARNSQPEPGDWRWTQPAAWQPLAAIAGYRIARRSRRERQPVST
jgi:hypothetical protein